MDPRTLVWDQRPYRAAQHATYLYQKLINPAHGQARRPVVNAGVTSRRSCGASRPASLRVGRKGIYIGMFEFICDVVTIPIWITARSYPGFSGSAGLTCFRLALHACEKHVEQHQNRQAICYSRQLVRSVGGW